MTPAVVVDIGNSRMKWGRVVDGAIAQHVSLPHDDLTAWETQFAKWPSQNRRWLMASVVPRAARRVSEWLAERGIECVTLTNRHIYDHVPNLHTRADEPDRVGTDRLVNAYAASRLAHAESDRPMAAVAISVGTAMTIDFLEADGTILGGAILPGPRMMAKSLNDHTAQLPVVEVGRFLPRVAWSNSTEGNISLGITRAIVHAADGMISDWAETDKPFDIFITGGDADIFRDFLFAANWNEVRFEPTLALEGLRLVAEHLP